MYSISRPFFFALRALYRDRRAGELRILVLALLTAVASLSAIDFFTSRIQQGMEYQATELMGADLVLLSKSEISAEAASKAHELGLQTARTISFRSMAAGSEELVLSEVKAAGTGYPLRGRLRTSDVLFGPARETTEIPAFGEVWVESRLLSQLGVEIGGTLGLGKSTFRISRVLVYEPDRGGELFQLAPRLLMNLDDLPATGLLGPGSRVNYRLLAAGESAAVEKLRAWSKNREAQWEVQGIKDARPELRRALSQAERFLSLAALTAVILAGAAVAVAARSFTRRQMNTAAVLRCLGVEQSFLDRAYLWYLFFLAVLSGLLGLVLGYLLQLGLSTLIAGLFLYELPPPMWEPVLPAFATAFLTLAAFALPAVLRIREVPPLRVLRQDLGPPPPSLWKIILPAVLGIAVLIYWQAGALRLAVVIFLGLLVTVAAPALAAWLLLHLLRPLRERAGTAWRFGLANLLRRAPFTILQSVGFGVGIMALLLLAVVRVDLLENWRHTLPTDTPNYFVLNIQSGEVAAMQEKLREADVDAPLYPMLPAPIMSINGRAVNPDDYDSPRAKRLARRAFNLSWSDHIPAHNSITAGRAPDGPGQCTIENGLAKTLRIKIGDVLRFQAAGQDVEARVTGLREVEWDSFQVNFFFILTPDLLQNLPASYITSFYLEPSRSLFLNDLARSFPSISILDVAALLAQIRGIMDRAVPAVEYVFGLTLAAGLLVLYAAIQAGRRERIREAALLRTLGARRRQVIAAAAAEFVTLGALAGLLGALAAGGIGYVLALKVFELPTYFNPWLLPAGMLSGACGVGLAGLLGTYGVLRHPPTEVLRQNETG